MKILQKYLIKELTLSSITVFSVFMLILSANTMLRLVEEASVGNFPTYLLFPLIIIKITQYSVYLLPISVFFGIILTFGRLYSNNEMAVIISSGISPIHLAKLISKVIILFSLTVGFFSLYLTPSATEYRYKLEHRLNSEERIEEISPGRFTSSQSGKATFFVNEINSGKLNNIFFSTSGSNSITVENSSTASYVTSDDVKYLVLYNGVINEVIPPDLVTSRKTEYDAHGIQLGQNLPKFYNEKYDATSTLQLLGDSSLEAKVEFQSRIMLPIATLLLCYLAIPLSYSSPRKGRYNKIFLASVIYFIYLILMSVSEKMFLLKYIPDIFGLWWLHALVAMIVYYIYIRDNKVIPNRS